MILSRFISKLTDLDDKYSHGVVGFVTGSEKYPGAALLGVSAAIRAGAGLVRYLGTDSAERLVLSNRPEVVLQDGRADAWVLGSGIATDSEMQIRRVVEKQTEALLVIDAEALFCVDYEKVSGLAVLTPPAGELVKLLNRFGVTVDRETVQVEPEHFALLAAEHTGQCVLLKGHSSFVAQNGVLQKVGPNSPALATAGSGDVLAGVLGALLAANREKVTGNPVELLALVEFAVQLHSAAAANLAKTQVVAALDLTQEIGRLVAALRTT